MREGLKSEAFEWGKAVLFAIIAVFLVKTFLFDIVAIDGISMQPTLYDKDKIAVNIAGYYVGKPSRQDVIVFTPPVDKNSYFIKRVIGVAGDDVKISDGRVFLNDRELDESYLPPGTRTQGDLILRVPEGMVFVLGDNREHSEDSRYFGPISIKSIKGRAIFRLFPLNSMEGL